METDFQTVEINGVKLEVDMRTARKIENYKIGDRVKVLVKSYQTYKPHPGVIVAFDLFENLPTITVAYVDVTYSKAEINFAYINANDTDTEIAPYNDDILVDKAQVTDLIDREIAKNLEAVEDLKRKKAYFDKNFALYFADMEDLASRVDG